jgi:hypothetical protein
VSDLKIQGVVEMSSEGAERALDRVAEDERGNAHRARHARFIHRAPPA